MSDVRCIVDEQLALLETLFRHAPVGLAFIDRDYRHVRINERLAAINGLPVSEHLGRTVQEMVPELWPSIRSLCDRALDGETIIDHEVAGTTAASEGETRDWLVSYFPVRHGDEVVGVGVIVNDVTRRKRTERDLAVRNELYAMLSRANRAINSSRSEEQLYRELCQIAVETGRFKFVWIGVPRGHRLEVIAAAGDDDGYLNDLVISLEEQDPRSQGPTGRAAVTGRAFVVNDFRGAPMTALWHERATRAGIAASAALPFSRGGSLAGVLTLFAPERGFFTDELVATLSEILPSVSVALDAFVRERDRRTAEAALLQSEQRYRGLIDSIPALMWVYAADGRPIMHNRRWYEFTGQTPADTAEHRWTDALHPDDAQSASEIWQRSLATGAPFTSEYRLRDRDGRYKWFLSQGSLIIIGSAGSQWVGICTDIDDWKIAQQSLATSEGRFRAFMDNSPTLTWVTAEDGAFVFANAAFHAAMGMSKDALSGRCIFDVMPRPLAEVYAENNRRVLETGRLLETTEQGPRVDGILGEYLVYKFPVPSAEPRRMVGGIAVDVTDLRRVESELRLRDRAIQAITQGIVISDPTLPDNPIIYASPSFTQMTGYSLEEVVGRNCRFLQGRDTDPAAVALLRNAVREVRRCDVEFLNYRKDGTPFWNFLTISPVFGADGTLAHFIGVQTDVTERRTLEEQFRQSQKLEAVGQIAGGVAHDFNNWLTVIYGCGELLLSRCPAESPDRALLLDIRRAAEQAGVLTRQLLSFSRQQVLAPRVLDLNAIVRDTQTMLRRSIGEDVALIIRLGSGIGLIKADPGQVEQILINLAVNARDAMPGGGQLTIETDHITHVPEAPDQIADLPAGDYSVLRVSDTGTGMDATTIARIFEPFFTTKPIGKGTGLGLATVHRIVRQARGQIAVASQPGRGTTFSVYLPTVSDDRTQEPAASSVGELPRGSARILLVEDDTMVRALMRRVLEGCGYIVVEAADGEQALERVASDSTSIELLISDVIMPRMGGRAIAEKVRILRPHCKVLLVSGYTNDDVIRRDILAAEYAFLQKPFSPAGLAEKVRRVLASRDPA